jgi:hypothetical protein
MDERPPWAQDKDPFHRWADVPEPDPNDDTSPLVDLFFPNDPPGMSSPVKRLLSSLDKVIGGLFLRSR